MNKIINTKSIILFDQRKQGLVTADKTISLPLNMKLLKSLYLDKGCDICDCAYLYITVDYSDDIANRCNFYLDDIFDDKINRLKKLTLVNSTENFINKIALKYMFERR